MKNFYSLSEFPGKTGQYFYTEFFKLYHIDANYTPLGANKNNFELIFKSLLKDAAGISISMPFKQDVIEYLDNVDTTVSLYNSCNSILVKEGKLFGYNSDLDGVIYSTDCILPNENITILGNGAIGKMFHAHLHKNKYSNISVYSRSLSNWDRRHESTDIVINCTALGTSTSNSPLDYIPKNTRLVIDVAIKENKLFRQCQKNSISYISGQDFYKHQFRKQFKFYTGIEIDLDQFDLIRKQKND